MNKNLFIKTRRLTYITLGLYDKLILKKSNEIFILCYHSISNDSWEFSIKPDEFKRQINYLLDKYQFISAFELFEYLNNRITFSRPSVLICFDDGYKDLINIQDFLKDKNIKPLLFVISNKKSINRNELNTNKSLLSYKEINDLIKSGWTIGSHSQTHSNFKKINKNQIRSEIINSKKNLEKNLNIKIDYFAFPKGNYNYEDLEIIRQAGYKLSFSMDDRLVVKQTNPYCLPRIGVDNSHSFFEFQTLASPSVIKARKLLRRYNIWNLV